MVRSISELGYSAPREIQLKTMPRMLGGQDIIAVGPEGSGKTTAYVLAVLNRFNYAPDGVPQVLILVPDEEKVEKVMAQFNAINKNKSIVIAGLHAGAGLEAQMDTLADGADIVIATPDRARAIYLKLGLNLNKIEVLVIDDAEQIVKQGLQLPVTELANSITKAQHLVFTQVLHDKLSRMIDPFMKLPAVIEVEGNEAAKLNMHSQVLYHVPNFGTKLNLLILFALDEELFTKMVVFANTRQTIEKLYQSLYNPENNFAALFKPHQPGINGFGSIADFIADPQIRVLIIANEDEVAIDVSGAPFVLHFDLPDDKELFINRLLNEGQETADETMGITFATDLELAQVRKIEQATGQKIPVADLPEELVIAEDKKPRQQDTGAKKDDPTIGAAFHEKKASNSKNYNYSSGEKARMNKKKKYG